MASFMTSSYFEMRPILGSQTPSLMPNATEIPPDMLTARGQVDEAKDEKNIEKECEMLLSLAEFIALNSRGGTDWEEALSSVEEAILKLTDIKEQEVATKLEATAQLVLVKVYSVRKKSLQMKEAASKALTLFSTVKDKGGQAKALQCKAQAYAACGDAASAVKNAQKALVLYRDLGDKEGQLVELMSVAKWQLSQNKMYAAQHAASLAHSMAIALLDDIDSSKEEAFSLLLMCQSLVASGRASQAVEKARKGLDHIVDVNPVAGHLVLIYALLSSESPMDAMDTVKSAQGYRAVDDKLKLDVLFAKAQAEIKNGMKEEAAKTMRSAAFDARIVDGEAGEGDASRMVSFALSGIPNLDQEQDILDEAIDAATKAKEFYSNVGAKSDEASALLLTAVLKSQRQSEDQAEAVIASLKEAQALYSDVEDVDGEASALNLLTDLHIGSEQQRDALGFAAASAALWEQAGNIEAQAEALQVLASIHVSTKDFEEAESKIFQAQSLGSVSKSLQATLALTLAKIYVEEGSEDDDQQEYQLKALKAAQSAVALAGQSGKKDIWATALSWEAQVLAWSSRPAEAMRCAEKSEKAFGQLKDVANQAMAMIKVAQLLKQMGKKADAKTKANEALEFAKENECTAAEKEAQAFIESMVEKRAATRGPGGTRMVRKLVKKWRKKGGGGGGAKKGGGLDIVAARGRVTKLVQNVLTDDEDVEADTPFMEAGIDSLGSVQLVTDVGKEFQMALAPSVVFDFPTVRALAEHLVAEAGDAAGGGGGDDGDGEWEEYEDWEDVEEAIEGEYIMEAAPVQTQAIAAAPAAASAAVAQESKALDKTMVVKKLTDLVKNVLTDDEDVESDTPFMEAGIDSLGSVQLVTDVGKAFQMALAPSVVFDFPTVRTLADHLVEESKG